MKTLIEIIGVYPIRAEEPVHLIEMQFMNLPGRFDLCGITQEWPGHERGEWQVPYLEQILDASGSSLLANWMEIDETPELWKGDVRMVFFFHYLSFDCPLKTPFGDAPLPRPLPLPDRLTIITYHAPS